ncbi:hypothetical protein ACTWPT_25070 [Nonomuraea sp. 3N208]
MRLIGDDLDRLFNSGFLHGGGLRERTGGLLQRRPDTTSKPQPCP